MSEWSPDDCAGDLCPPGRLPARWRWADHCVWSRAPGELWWRRRLYCRLKDANKLAAELADREPDSEFAVRPNDAGPPGEGDDE